MSSMSKSPGSPGSEAVPEGAEESLLEHGVAQSMDRMRDPFVIAKPILDDSGMVVDLEWIYANEAACTYNDMPHDQMIGMRVLDLLPNTADSGLFDAYVDVLATGEPLDIADLPYAHERQGDQALRYVLRAWRVGSNIGVTWRDVTPEREADDLLRLFMELAPHGVALAAPDGAYTTVNPALCTFLRAPAAELVGSSWTERIHPDDVPATALYVEELLSGEREQFTHAPRFQRADGTTERVEVSVAANRGSDGTVKRLVLHFGGATGSETS